MKKGSTIILRGVVILIGTIVFGLCAFALPAGIISDKVSYYRPILIGMYLPAIPFFFALNEALKILGYIDKNKAFSELSVKALNNIKYSAIIIGALYTAGMPYIFYVADKDDAPGVAAIGFVIIFAAFVIATAAAVFQSLFQNAVDLKSENDLTI
jgi:MFS family permease